MPIQQRHQKRHVYVCLRVLRIVIFYVFYVQFPISRYIYNVSPPRYRELNIKHIEYNNPQNSQTHVYISVGMYDIPRYRELNIKHIEYNILQNSQTHAYIYIRYDKLHKHTHTHVKHELN